MPNRELKKKVLEAAKSRLQEMANDFRSRVDELKEVTVDNENAETASQTESRSTNMELLGSLSDQLDGVKKELELLDQIDPAVAHEEVTFGSVVHTESRNFLISTGVEDFEVDGRHYLGLSPRAPLYAKLQHAKADDRVEFNGTEYHLKEVF